MQTFRQIVLCSTVHGQSFQREVCILGTEAVVTHMERLPFRYHEILHKRQNARDPIQEFTGRIYRPERYRFCPHCGHNQVFWCHACGQASCKDSRIDAHSCPCGKSCRTLNTAKASYGSQSGLTAHQEEGKSFSFYNLKKLIHYWPGA